MNGNARTLLDYNLSYLTGMHFALFTVAPTFTTNGTEVADADYVRVGLASTVGNTPADGTTSETRQVVNNLGVLTFGSAGAAGAYDIVAIGVIRDLDDAVLKWVPYAQSIAAGEIPRIPLNELTVIMG